MIAHIPTKVHQFLISSFSIFAWTGHHKQQYLLLLSTGAQLKILLSGHQSQ